MAAPAGSPYAEAEPRGWRATPESVSKWTPIRCAISRLKEMYSELGPGPPETVDARAMHLIVAPNNLGATKFYFDAGTHLLRRIEETGETSAYFKTSTDFLNYKTVNAVRFPFRIVHSTTEPGGAKEDLRVSKVIENDPVNPAAFSNPRADPNRPLVRPVVSLQRTDRDARENNQHCQRRAVAERLAEK